MMIRTRRWLTRLGILALVLVPPSAHAWDPSTTHQGMVEEAATRSAMHVRWMDGSALERGLFSDLRIDPDRLTADQRRLLQLAIHGSHADVGARPLGGPGACPSAGAPPSTQLFCVDQDIWQQSVLGWIRLGIVAEVTPVARQVHHFLDRDKPESKTWADPELPAVTLRQRQARSNGEPSAGVLTSTNFAGTSASAIAWLEDPSDPLAPPQMLAHLEAASTAATRVERDHHLALALMGVGALIHVVQDLGVPAHARGDATAFFSPLSPAPGDRGLPLQEFVRGEYGRRDLPGLGSLPTARPTGVPLSTTLLGHVLGDAGYGGLATLASRRFFSESSLPPARYLELGMTATDAAQALLGDEPSLDPTELDGATLSPWPAETGYLLSPTGRALAAFDTDVEGRIRCYLDEAVYREQATSLVPATVDVTRSLLDLLWPQWPQMYLSSTKASLEIPAEWTSGELIAFAQDEHGDRVERQRVALVPGGDVRVELPSLASGGLWVLVILAERGPAPRVVLERALGASDVAVDTGPIPVVPYPM